MRPTNGHITLQQPVHAVSTLSVFGEGRGPGVRLEENDELLGVSVHGGYSQSKWVADRMLIKVWSARRASGRGILFRLAYAEPVVFLCRHSMQGCPWLSTGLAGSWAGVLLALTCFRTFDSYLSVRTSLIVGALLKTLLRLYSTVTGVGNPDDFFSCLLRGCIQLGAFPDYDDVCGRCRIT